VTAPASPPVEVVAPPAPPASPITDLASVVAFVALGVFVASSIETVLFFEGVGPFGRETVREAVFLFAAALAFVGAGIERGRARAPSGAFAVALALTAAATATGALAWLRAEPPELLPTIVRTAILIVIAWPLTRLGGRWERGEDAWRAEARTRPPEATPPLAYRIAAARPPRAVELLLLPLAPVGIAAGLVALVAIKLYQLTLSRLMPPVCRFEPSCSRYAYQAVHAHGAARGTVLAVYRVARCQPFCRDGHDPVPPREGPAKTFADPSGRGPG
jgi:putative membrane protein insertion efficiency factor